MSEPDIDKLVAKAILKALKAGLSEARGLQDAGLLLTPRGKVTIAATALSDVADLLEQVPISEIVPAGGGISPADMKRWIALWIRDIADENRKDSHEPLRH